MTHPLVPQIIELATPIAQDLGLEVVDVVFQTNQRPPILRVDVRNLTSDTGLDDCEQMSRALEAQLDTVDLIPDAYVLEVSSPGVSRQIQTEREFIAFKGFAVRLKTYAPYEGQKEWQGRLQGRDAENVYLNQKGRVIAIPRQLVASIALDDHR